MCSRDPFHCDGYPRSLWSLEDKGAVAEAEGAVFLKGSRRQTEIVKRGVVGGANRTSEVLLVAKVDLKSGRENPASLRLMESRAVKSSHHNTDTIVLMWDASCAETSTVT